MRTRYTGYCIIFSACLLLLPQLACKKLIEVDVPSNELPGEDVFASDVLADAAIADIYYNLSGYFTGNIFSIINGMTADELNTLNTAHIKYVNNAIISGDALLLSVWRDFYESVYGANAALEGIAGSSGLSAGKAAQLRGEALFLRAFCYYYLVNCWGDVPLITTTDVAKTALASRTAVAIVYQQIMTDLTQAIELLPGEYGNQEKVRACKWAATALLARVYIQQGNWEAAETQASAVINTGAYTPLPPPDSVFLRNSRSAILQIWMQDGFTLPGQALTPASPGSYTFYPLTEELINSFEPGDIRKTTWTGTFSYGGIVYHYPYKYKKRTATTGTDAEYLMILRIEEQYLIRAEARAQQNNIEEAVADLNLIRQGGGLAALPEDINKNNCLQAIQQERKIELFTEWGDRWQSLKRTGEIDAVLGTLKTTWKTTSALYPIPQQERNRNPNLTQNNGYE